MSSLTYTVPGWWPWAVVCFVLVAAVSGWIFIRRPHSHLSRRLRTCLWALRVIAALLLLACLLDWRRETVRQTSEKPAIRVLIDKSASMAVKDGPEGRARFEEARKVLEDRIAPVWKDSSRLETGFAGEKFLPGDPASAAPDAMRSALGASLRGALEHQGSQALGGVLLLSDGAASDPDALRATAGLYRAARVPVFPWVLGTQAQPADLRIASADLRQPSPSQATIHLELGVESPGYEGKEAELEVRFGTQVLYRQRLKLDGGSQAFTADFLSPYRGCHFYDLVLSPLEGEASAANNRMRVACDVRREPIRVLYMEGSVPSETAFLKEGLEVDPEMEVTCLHFPGDSSLEALARQAIELRGKDSRVFQDGKGRPVPSVCHPTRGYPRTLEELLKYDVVINSDIIKEAFSPEQMAATVAFVEEFGGGFVMVGGQTSFGAGGYEKTVIDKLMPVEIANNSDPFWFDFKVKVTDSGLNHPVMKVGKDASQTQAAWTRDFPGFGGANYARRAKPGAHVLARVGAPGSPMDDLVLFAVQQIGRGRTMAFMSDTTTSWGAAFETSWGPAPNNPEYFRRFWNNTVRWLAADRIARKSGQAVLELPQVPVTTGDPVAVNLAALSAAELAGLEVTVKEADRDLRVLPMQWNGASRRWEGSFTAEQAGDVLVEARYRNAEGAPVAARAGIAVRNESDETVAVAAKPELMEMLARETGGTVLNDGNVKEVLDGIGARSMPVTWKRAVPVWDRWWVLVPLLLVIVAEWLLRRRREPARSERGLQPASPAQ